MEEEFLKKKEENHHHFSSLFFPFGKAGKADLSTWEDTAKQKK